MKLWQMAKEFAAHYWRKLPMIFSITFFLTAIVAFYLGYKLDGVFYLGLSIFNVVAYQGEL